ncbi:unnamed protein product [Rotaria magnacalcarata]|uniref:Uncharacterized protein n=1 Tax=Rotaria magnacalcarata TaxID=392030 RepID=A0A8S2XP52_9BILA|nr:unnamed protein product [Rotaria magnacalcarata]
MLTTPSEHLQIKEDYTENSQASHNCRSSVFHFGPVLQQILYLLFQQNGLCGVSYAGLPSRNSGENSVF